MTSPRPKNQKLYNRVKVEAKKRFKAWPSAYASGWLVKEYKKRGGTYMNKTNGEYNKRSKPNRRSKSRKYNRRGKSRNKSHKPNRKTGLQRWFAEEWIDVCYYPRKVSCGRSKGGFGNYAKNYPYCRPYKRISRKTPTTARELTKSQRKSRCAQKRRSPHKRMGVKTSRRSIRVKTPHKKMRVKSRRRN